MSGLKTAWSPRRLARLFDRYNGKFWAGRIGNFTVSAPALGGPLGLCDSKAREIHIDVEAHRTDREVRSTLLHEMAHGAAGRCRIAHGYKFWAEVEGLLKKGAPIDVTNSEAPGLRILAGAVPKRFPLARLAVERIERARVKELEKQTFDDVEEITDAVIVERFEEAAMVLHKKELAESWRTARWTVGLEYGLLDVGGKPRNAWAARVIAEGKRAFMAKRRFWIRMLRTRKGR